MVDGNYVAESPQKLTGYQLPMQRLLSYRKTNVKLIVLAYMSKNSENLVKIGPLLSEIIGRICNFLKYRSKSCNFWCCNLGGYWTKSHQISTQCRWIIAILTSEIEISILQSISERQCNEWRWDRPTSQIWPKSVGIEKWTSHPIHPLIVQIWRKSVL